MAPSKDDQKITIVYVINGEEWPTEANLAQPLHASVQHALATSRNTGRDPSEWEVRDARGVALEKGRKVGELDLTDGVKLFLSLAVGAGG